ncbi:MAG: hypothetical protein CSB48_07500 [Proteobacteria bacterium]|nr:MAG: hypothetical protein CSB48_07500 [Pseudomonadota bacterium]
MIEGRCFELYPLPDDWGNNTGEINEIISSAVDYKIALVQALKDFRDGKKYKKKPELSFPGIGIDLTSKFESLFYQQTENLIHDALAHINLEQPQEDMVNLYAALKAVVIRLFDQATESYQQEPKMLKALASSRRLLHKYLNELEAQGGNHESAKKA